MGGGDPCGNALSEPRPPGCGVPSSPILDIVAEAVELFAQARGPEKER